MSVPRTLEHDWFPRPLPTNITAGNRSWIYSSFSCIHYRSNRPLGVRIGHDTGIYSGTFFDLGPDAEVTIGNYCTLVGVIISSNQRVAIGDYAFLAHEVVLADSFAAAPFCNAFRLPAGADSDVSKAGIAVGENSWIGARAILLAGAKIGEGAIVGAAAVIDFEVPPFMVAAGNPARVVAEVRRAS